jgi:hypothetical protein
MKTAISLLLLSVLTGGVFGALKPNLKAEPAEVRMSEGFFLDGIEGILQKDTDQQWSFLPQQKISLTEKRDFPEGKSLPMLPSSVLEQMVQMAEGQPLHVRLWALATQYRQDNYLYAVYFMPLKGSAPKTKTQASTQAKEDQPVEQQTPVEEEESIIPMDILAQIKSDTAPDLQRFQKVAEVTGDTNLIGRAGYLQESGNRFIFVPDAFGQNVNFSQYMLLPAATLESAEKKMQKTPGRQRYTVSGLVTMFDGKPYLLLRRAERTFTHGNFTQ